MASASWQIMPPQAGTTRVPEGKSLAKPAESFQHTSLHITSISLTSTLFSNSLLFLSRDVNFNLGMVAKIQRISFPGKPLYAVLAYRKKGLNPKNAARSV